MKELTNETGSIMPKRKTKAYVKLSRNSYKGRLKGVLPAFLPNRCDDLTDDEVKRIANISASLKNLVATMDSNA